MRADSFFHAPPKPADGVSEMLATLKERGYLLGLISNTGMTPGRLFRTYLEDLGVIHLFDQLTFSDEVLLAKPSPAIFLTTLSALGATPEQGVHVGDHLRNDIAGAHEAGIRSVWLEGFDDSEIVVKPTTTIQRIADLPIREAGARVVRVRVSGTPGNEFLRVEVAVSEMARVIEVHSVLADEGRRRGYRWTVLDLAGYRVGGAHQ